MLIPSVAMKKLDLELEVGAVEMTELRPVLDTAITDHFAEGIMRHRWEGDVLRLTGPGAKGSVVYEAGRLRLRAQLKPPASWVHRTIRKKVDAALGDVAAHVERAS